MLLAAVSSHFSWLYEVGVGGLIAICAVGKLVTGGQSLPSANGNGRRARAYGPGIVPATSGAFACPGCGAVLHDLTAETCPYCGAAFLQASPERWRRVWRTDDYGATWTIVERTCPSCGGLVSDPAAAKCPKCGHEPLPPLAPKPDPRPTAAIKIKLPPFRDQSGELRQNTNLLVRYIESRHWPVPPPVPKAIATILRPLPDTCPSCGATDFNVVLNSNQDAWEVVCARCGVNPGVRADAD